MAEKPRRKQVGLAGAEWAFLERPGEGRPVVFLHGFTGTSHDVLAVLPALGDRPVWALDLPGHGQTRHTPPGPTCTLDGVAAGLAALFERCSEAPDLIGYSMGGRLALALTATARLAPHRLVLISASPGLSSEAERSVRGAADAELARRIEALGTRRFTTEWSAQPMFARVKARCAPELYDPLRKHRRHADAQGLAAALRGLGTGTLPGVWDRLDQVKCATLCLTGAEDAKFQDVAVGMAARVPEMRHVMIEGAGHALHLEANAACVGHVSGFLGEPSR